ncbi:MAG: OmpA family protein [Alphaproteobacteria bacterium]
MSDDIKIFVKAGGDGSFSDLLTSVKEYSGRKYETYGEMYQDCLRKAVNKVGSGKKLDKTASLDEIRAAAENLDQKDLLDKFYQISNRKIENGTHEEELLAQQYAYALKNLKPAKDETVSESGGATVMEVNLSRREIRKMAKEKGFKGKDKRAFKRGIKAYKEALDEIAKDFKDGDYVNIKVYSDGIPDDIKKEIKDYLIEKGVDENDIVIAVESPSGDYKEGDLNYQVREGSKKFRRKKKNIEEENNGASLINVNTVDKHEEIIEAIVIETTNIPGESQLTIPLYFKTGSSELTPEAEKILDKLITAGVTPDQIQQIIGKASSSGSDAYNQKLSDKRLGSALAYVNKETDWNLQKGTSIKAVGEENSSENLEDQAVNIVVQMETEKADELLALIQGEVVKDDALNTVSVANYNQTAFNNQVVKPSQIIEEEVLETNVVTSPVTKGVEKE